jgi:hypothetical protein
MAGTVATSKENAMTTKFEVGQTYTCRSFCDYDCIYSFDVVSRTEKTVTVRYHGELRRRKIEVYDDVEQIHPHGRYSMAAILSADRKSK